MKIHTYKNLASPIAQIAAAEQFCASLVAFVADEYQEAHDEAPPDVDEIHPLNVLDTLARLGLRFDTDGRNVDKGDHAYFHVGSERSPLGKCLFAYAGLVADDFTENQFILYEDEGDGDVGEVPSNRPSVLQMITIHGCWSNLVFVPDFEHVASEAYFLLLTPGRLPLEATS